MSIGRPPGAENARSGITQFFSSRGAAQGLACGALLLAGRVAVAEPAYETVVTAPAPTAREDHTASVSVITTDRTPRSGEDLPRLLSELPGVTVTRYGSYGSLATLSLRGSTPNQVAVYVDGVPLGSALTGGVDLGLVPMSPVSRIEVYRGTSPLGFGSSAMGGIVSLTSEAPEATGAAVHSGVGSFATRFGGGELGYRGERLSVVARAALFKSRADFPYLDDNGTAFVTSDDRRLRRENNQMDQADAALRAQLALGERRSLALAFGALDRDQGLPARGTTRSFEAQLARKRAHASLQYSGRDDLGPGGELRATLYGLGSRQRFRDPRGELSLGGPAHTYDDALSTGGSVTGLWPALPALQLSGLLDARRERFWPHDELHPERRPEGTRDLGAAGLAGTVFVDAAALELIATLRGEAARDEVSPRPTFANQPARPFTRSAFLPVARLGLVASPRLPVGELRLRANGGTYGRLATLFELYGNGGTVLGSPGLLPERGQSGDVGATFAFDSGGTRLQVDAALFGARAAQLIVLQESSYYAQFANVAKARMLGAELGVSGQLARVAHLFAQLTYLDARDRSDNTATAGKRLPRLPALRGYLRPELRALPLGRAFAAGLYADVELVGARFSDPSNLVRLPARQVFGAGATLAYRPAGLRALLSAYNLGDARGLDVLEYPLPGRSFFVTLEFAYCRKEPVR